MTAALCLNGDIQLGNLVFNTIDSDGTTWAITDIEGWWTIPEPNIPDYEMGLGDGSYETAGRYGARIFTISGWFQPRDKSMVPVARRKLIAQADLCRRSTWFMTHESDYTRGSLVVLSGSPQISTTKPNGQTLFQIGLKAADPIKYAINGRVTPGWYTTAGSGSFTVTNAGDYAVRPIVSLGSAGAGATVKNNTTGDTMVVRLGYSGTLVVDNKMRSVTRSGLRNQRFYLTWDTDWLQLAPGANSITTSGVSATFQYRHGWIG